MDSSTGDSESEVVTIYRVSSRGRAPYKVVAHRAIALPDDKFRLLSTNKRLPDRIVRRRNAAARCFENELDAYRWVFREINRRLKESEAVVSMFEDLAGRVAEEILRLDDYDAA